MKDYETANRDNRDRQALLLQRAKLAYDAFEQGFPMSWMPPFEHLGPQRLEAWKRVVTALDAEPVCSECGTGTQQVLCPGCEVQIR
jgi:hypothetical protein